MLCIHKKREAVARSDTRNCVLNVTLMRWTTCIIRVHVVVVNHRLAETSGDQKLWARIETTIVTL